MLMINFIMNLLFVWWRPFLNSLAVINFIFIFISHFSNSNIFMQVFFSLKDFLHYYDIFMSHTITFNVRGQVIFLCSLSIWPNKKTCLKYQYGKMEIILQTTCCRQISFHSLTIKKKNRYSKWLIHLEFEMSLFVKD